MNVFEEYFSSGVVRFSKLHEFLQLWLWFCGQNLDQYVSTQITQMKTREGRLLALSEILNVYMIFFHLHPSILRDFGPLCEIKN